MRCTIIFFILSSPTFPRLSSPFPHLVVVSCCEPPMATDHRLRTQRHRTITDATTLPLAYPTTTHPCPPATTSTLDGPARPSVPPPLSTPPSPLLLMVLRCYAFDMLIETTAVKLKQLDKEEEPATAAESLAEEV